MKLTVAFLKLIRLPNLIILALTQVLFQYCIYNSLQPTADVNFNNKFLYLVLASILIAAAGNIINDYFDINIDEINKPQQMVIDKIINRRWAIAWHSILSAVGIVFTILALPASSKWYLVLINIICVILLWFYSANFKKKLIIGNLIVAVLSAWAVLLVFYIKIPPENIFGEEGRIHRRIFRIAFLYGGFAFITTLIREAIKDMEDMEGDSKYGCKTMPIVWGLNATKVYTAVWLIVLIATMIIIQVYILQFNWWIPALYCSTLIMLPSIYIFYKLFKATTPQDFHQLSNWMKGVMLTGIISMSFFYFYL